MSESRIIVALDTNDPRKAAELVEKLLPHVYSFKIGLELITSMLQLIADQNFDQEEALIHLRQMRYLFDVLEGRIFWDGKFHDIPNTVAGAAAAVSRLEVSMFNVHASAGTEAMKAAVMNKGRAKVLAVTILTSLAGECEIIYGAPAAAKVLQLAERAIDCGMDGIICSAEEAPMLRPKDFMKEKIIITPGIRPSSSDPGDQKRISTPYNAIRGGSDYLVVGRPITEASDPVAAADAINQKVEEALASTGDLNF